MRPRGARRRRRAGRSDRGRATTPPGARPVRDRRCRGAGRRRPAAWPRPRRGAPSGRWRRRLSAPSGAATPRRAGTLADGPRLTRRPVESAKASVMASTPCRLGLGLSRAGAARRRPIRPTLPDASASVPSLVTRTHTSAVTSILSAAAYRIIDLASLALCCDGLGGDVHERTRVALGVIAHLKIMVARHSVRLAANPCRCARRRDGRDREAP